MSKIANTLYKDNNLASDFHRVSGKYSYVTDIDLIPSGESENTDNMFFEYKYENGNVEPVACIDFKMPGKSLSDKYSAIKAQISISNKLNVPFFFAVTYLDERYPTKCYYIIPINEIARNNLKIKGVGAWCSLKEYSKFQHKLRNITWNGNEPIEPKNAEVVGLSCKTLADLPNTKQKYELPNLDFSWK